MVKVEPSYWERMRTLGCTTLETQRLRGDLIEVFTILKGSDNGNCADFLLYATVLGHSETTC